MPSLSGPSLPLCSNTSETSVGLGLVLVSEVRERDSEAWRLELVVVVVRIQAVGRDENNHET